MYDGQLRTAIRAAGIGTPATRAAVIETLFARNYIRRDKKNLVPTEKGLAVYDTVKDTLSFSKPPKICI